MAPDLVTNKKFSEPTGTQSLTLSRPRPEKSVDNGGSPAPTLAVATAYALLWLDLSNLAVVLSLPRCLGPDCGGPTCDGANLSASSEAQPLGRWRRGRSNRPRPSLVFSRPARPKGTQRSLR